MSSYRVLLSMFILFPEDNLMSFSLAHSTSGLTLIFSVYWTELCDLHVAVFKELSRIIQYFSFCSWPVPLAYGLQGCSEVPFCG